MVVVMVELMGNTAVVVLAAILVMVVDRMQQALVELLLEAVATVQLMEELAEVEQVLLAKVQVALLEVVEVLDKAALEEKMDVWVKILGAVLVTCTELAVFTEAVAVALVVLNIWVQVFKQVVVDALELFGVQVDSFPQLEQEICNGVL
jgi:hypothetical protein